METNHDVCIAHLKWAPCLTKSDWENECIVVSDAQYNKIMRKYHSGVLTPDEAIEQVKNNYGKQTFVRCVHAIG